MKRILQIFLLFASGQLLASRARRGRCTLSYLPNVGPLGSFSTPNIVETSCTIEENAKVEWRA